MESSVAVTTSTGGCLTVPTPCGVGFAPIPSPCGVGCAAGGAADDHKGEGGAAGVPIL